MSTAARSAYETVAWKVRRKVCERVGKMAKTRAGMMAA